MAEPKAALFPVYTNLCKSTNARRHKMAECVPRDAVYSRLLSCGDRFAERRRIFAPCEPEQIVDLCLG
jgi:hypothetical protein